MWSRAATIDDGGRPPDEEVDVVPKLGPRIVIAGTRSGTGKTSVATGLMAALTARGLRVAPAKVGPDLVDARCHEAATGRPGRNLDAWMSGPDLIAPLAARAARESDVLVVEGVMGLFDGAADGSVSSTADIAVLLDAPVVLVVDCSSQAASVAAVVHGFSTFDPRIRLAGVVLNHLGSASHEAMVRTALERIPRPVPVLGAIRREDRLRDRVPTGTGTARSSAPDADAIAAFRDTVEGSCDLDAILGIARRVPTVEIEPLPRPRRVGSARVAVVTGASAGSGCRDDLDALEAAGAEPIPFDPTVEDALPPGIDALLVTGGFTPDAVRRSGRASLREDLRTRSEDGLVVWAAGTGAVWLARSLDGDPMMGIVPTDVSRVDRLTLGYRDAVSRIDTPLGPAGTRFRGHVVHRLRFDPAGDALEATGRTGTERLGHGTPRILISPLEIPLVARPDLAEAFVRSACGLR